MDPLAHTLVGGALAASGLRKLTRLGTATLLIGANLPDVDATAYAIGDDLALAVRRGWTHGVLAAALWPLALTAAMVVADRLTHRRTHLPRARAGPLLLLSVLAVASHPALDWLNTYGIRLLMPFDGRWFYGDTLFIADPWIWVLAGTAAALVCAEWRFGWPLIATVGVATSALVLFGPLAPPAAKIAWCALVAAGSVPALSRPDEVRSRRIAMACLAIVVLYVATMRLGTERASVRATEWLASQGVAVTATAALPVPADPFRRDVVAVAGDRYHFVAVNWATGSARMSGPPANVGGPTRVTDAAMRAPWVHGLAVWMRFPSFDVQPRGEGYRVFIRDVRFWRPDREWGVVGFGRNVVDLDRDLRPLRPPAGASGSAEAGWHATEHPCLEAMRQLCGRLLRLSPRFTCIDSPWGPPFRRPWAG